MFGQIGIPELIIVLLIAVTWAVPIAFTVWVIFALRSALPRFVTKL